MRQPRLFVTTFISESPSHRASHAHLTLTAQTESQMSSCSAAFLSPAPRTQTLGDCRSHSDSLCAIMQYSDTGSRSHLGSGLNKDANSRKTALFPTVPLLAAGHKSPLCSRGEGWPLRGCISPPSEQYSQFCYVRQVRNVFHMQKKHH